MRNIVGTDYIWITRTQEEVDRESNARQTNSAATNSQNLPIEATDSGSVWMIQEGSAITITEGVSATEGATEYYRVIVREEILALKEKVFC